MRILILGGTIEASQLARLLADDSRFEATMSLAGRTVSPKQQVLQTRIGGFGGIAGLETWLRDNGIAAVVDATHPYAAQISAHAVAACNGISIPLGSIIRAPWAREDGRDNWIEVETTGAAAHALGDAPARVFLSIGRQELAAFAAAPQHHYIARTIDPPDVALPPDISFVYDRGPFDIATEQAFLAREKIDMIVSKNSGGAATYPKIVASRRLQLPVVMISRPHKPHGVALDVPEAAMHWLETQLAHGASSSRRGV